MQNIIKSGIEVYLAGCLRKHLAGDIPFLEYLEGKIWDWEKQAMERKKLWITKVIRKDEDGNVKFQKHVFDYCLMAFAKLYKQETHFNLFIYF